MTFSFVGCRHEVVLKGDVREIMRVGISETRVTETGCLCQ